MKKHGCIDSVTVVLCLAAFVCSPLVRADDSWRRPFAPDEHTVVLYHFDEGHHVAWQYHYEEGLHQLFLDGKLIWRMTDPDGRKLVNDRKHKSQFSVFTRLRGYTKYGGRFNFLGYGNFFGQIGEIRISNVRRYGR